MSQKQRILEHLKTHGSIDPLTSWAELGIYRLASRINDIRKDGYNIQTDKKSVKNRFGEKVTVANYKIVMKNKI